VDIVFLELFFKDSVDMRELSSGLYRSLVFECGSIMPSKGMVPRGLYAKS
jgi:hypothetical protein